MLLINSNSGDGNSNSGGGINSKHWYKLTNLKKNEEKKTPKKITYENAKERRQRVRKRLIRKHWSEIDVVKTKKHDDDADEEEEVKTATSTHQNSNMYSWYL